jgi:hypothetical protein
MKDLVSLAEFAVRKSQRGGAEESEAFLLSRREIQVAIENNQIKSGEVQEIEGLALRVIKNKGLGQLKKVFPVLFLWPSRQYPTNLMVLPDRLIFLQYHRFMISRQKILL